MSSPTLANKVAQMIRNDILMGELKPNQKLVVADLKEKYNVGASPIREALVELSWIKYVKLAPQKGCWVAPLCLIELHELYESLRVVSGVLLRKAIETGDESWELAVLTSFHKLSRIKQDAYSIDWIDWEEKHHSFHSALLEGSGSKLMFEFFNDVLCQVKRYRHFAAQSLSRDAAQLCELEEHEQIMKLVLAKKPDEAIALLDKHLETSLMQITSSVQAHAA
ncbi:FCD domain-containing protein [Vibrio sp. SM6]|uniref:FCD domain-containing protein n=1 Tax=Vibrio agarilyticus TaxID=2726741 RepID=A0A7X8TP86_9VIBR|nr:FCD domain-containing protein [Vibrio agarilyticus]